jgi:hypothetical protein
MGATRVRNSGCSHFAPERGCVVPTSRSKSMKSQSVSFIHALRLVFDTAAPRQNEECWAHLNFLQLSGRGKTRNSKSEIRRKSEIRNQKSELWPRLNPLG